MHLPAARAFATIGKYSFAEATNAIALTRSALLPTFDPPTSKKWPTPAVLSAKPDLAAPRKQDHADDLTCRRDQANSFGYCYRADLAVVASNRDTPW